MKIRIKVKHLWTFCVLALCMVFVIALPFTFISMVLVSDSPFWMWQFIYMFFAAIYVLDVK